MNGQQSYDDKFASMTRAKLRDQVEENKKLRDDLRALAVAAIYFMANTSSRQSLRELNKALTRQNVVSVLRIDEDGLMSAEELRRRHNAGWLLTRKDRIKAGLDKE